MEHGSYTIIFQINTVSFLYKTTAQAVGYRDPYESKMLQIFSWDQMEDTDYLRL